MNVGEFRTWKIDICVFFILFAVSGFTSVPFLVSFKDVVGSTLIGAKTFISEASLIMKSSLS